MGLIVAADINIELDYLIQGWLRYKTGVTNALASIAALDSTTFSVLEARSDIAPANVALKAKLDVNTLPVVHFKTLLTKIERHVQVQGGYAGLDYFLASLNPTSGTKWQGLQDYRLYDLWQLWKGTGVIPSIYNLYQEILQGATYANALAKWVLSGAVFTAGVAIDTTKYAGGVPYINCSAFAGSSGVITVTGTQYNPVTRTTTAGKTWTATVTGTGTFALAVGTADTDSLIAAVSAVSAGAGPSAGTILYIESHRPSGRVDVAA